MRKIIIIVILILTPVIIYFAFPEVMYNLVSSLELKSAGLTEKSTVAANHTISYIDGGAGENILLLHGYAADKSNWVRFSKFLTPNYHVIAIDLPGFGESSRNDKESYNITNQVKRLEKIVKRLGLQRFHLAGNSMGGTLAGKYTIEFSERVLSLAFFNTGGVYSCEKSEFISHWEKGKNILLIKTPDDFDKLLNFIFVKPPWIPRPIKVYLTNKGIFNRDFNEKIGNQLANEKYSLEPELSKIRVKTLILWGDTDRLIDVSCAKTLEKGLSNSKKVIMKDCGHCPMIERPEEAANHYLKFLKE